MKITLIGNSTGSAISRLRDEARELGVDFKAVSLASVILEVRNNTLRLTSLKHENILNSDCYMFRGIGDADQEVMIIAKYLQKHGSIIIEEKTTSGALMMDKIFLQATEESVPTPSYFMVQSLEALQSIITGIEYPVVMKSTIGSMGKNVALVESEAELYQQYELLGKRVIIQQYFAVDADVRAIVIGGKFVGAYQRTRSDGEFRMNRPGSTKQTITLPPEAVEICEHTARSQKIEIAGIDLIQYQNDWYVLEINTSPQFRQFEKYTKINVAKLIIEYAIDKYALKSKE